MLEDICLKAARTAAKELFFQALGQVKKRVLTKEEGEKKDKVRRHLTTRFGLTIFFRQELKQ
jgi:hypothetical protein